MDKRLRNLFIITFSAVGLGILFSKTKGVVELVRQAKFSVDWGGYPSIDRSCLRLPIAVVVQNPTSGTITARIDQLNAFINEGGKEQFAAAIDFHNGQKPELEILPYRNNVFYGLEIIIPISTLLTFVSTNLYDVINYNTSEILQRISIQGRATVCGNVQVNFKHSFAKETTVSGLGLVADELRTLKPFSDYSALIPPRTELNRNDNIVQFDGSTEDTVQIMKQVVAQTLGDTKRLAANLKKSNTYDSVKSVWDFVYDHIQYVRDDPQTEQVRRPLRTLYDREGDCDCYAVLCASLFQNMGIPWRFRITKYYNRSYWQHVYVIVPYGNSYLVCDPVMNKCFAEKEPTETKDF